MFACLCIARGAQGQGTGAGAGVALLTQYTIRADPNYDCGLLEAGGEERPALATWCGLTEFDANGLLPR